MRVFHGGITEVVVPDLDIGRQKVDFGRGFYVTTLENQAGDWAKSVSYRNSNSKIDTSPRVSVYEFEETDWLFEKRFIGYSEEWLMFVVNNRRSDIPILEYGYDVVRGNIADDKVIETINRFIEQLMLGRVDQTIVQATLRELSYQNENDQLCFKTLKALDYLKFIESYEVDDGKDR